jgi:hypothetical protein
LADNTAYFVVLFAACHVCCITQIGPWPMSHKRLNHTGLESEKTTRSLKQSGKQKIRVIKGIVKSQHITFLEKEYYH